MKTGLVRRPEVPAASVVRSTSLKQSGGSMTLATLAQKAYPSVSSSCH